MAERANSWRELAPVFRLVSATIVVGATCGAVIGGLGGRLAMRVVFLTSDDSVRGLTSDDGFEIGRFSLGDTLGLVVLTTVLGVIAALLYLVARPFLAPLGRAVTPAMAVFYGVVGGELMVHTDGVDFTLLEPAALAIALFVGLCAGFGAVVARLVDAAAAPGSWSQTRSWRLLGPPLLTLVFPPFLVVAAAAVIVNEASRISRPPRRWWRMVHAGALVVMSGLFIAGALNLASETAALT